jgi:hypothetical protein
MQFQLINAITANAHFKSNDNGTITVSGVVVQTKIIGSPDNKFIQSDIMSDIIIPADKTSATQPTFIQEEAAKWVALTYPSI